MKKLLALITLFAIAYPTAADARDLVLVYTLDTGAKTYVWRDSIRRVNQFVLWTSESVLFDSSGKATRHVLANYSGDCNEGITRLLKSKDLLDGFTVEILQNQLKITRNGVNVPPVSALISDFKKFFEPSLVIPGSVGETELNYVCGKRFVAPSK